VKILACPNGREVTRQLIEFVEQRRFTSGPPNLTIRRQQAPCYEIFDHRKNVRRPFDTPEARFGWVTVPAAKITMRVVSEDDVIKNIFRFAGFPVDHLDASSARGITVRFLKLCQNPAPRLDYFFERKIVTVKVLHEDNMT
jgi:hypothetical protein